MSQNKHLFAIHVPGLQSFDESDSQFVLTDVEIYFRITKILRLKKDECVILFSLQGDSCVTQILLIGSKSITFKIISASKAKVHQKKVCMGLALLKRNYLEDAVYYAAQNGVDEIALLSCEKNKGEYFDEKSLSRLQKIIVSANEQSKNFHPTKIFMPQDLKTFVGARNLTDKIILFDPDGVNIFELPKLTDSQATTFLIGPEAGFSAQEVHWLSESGAVSVGLGESILRAVDVALVASVLAKNL